VPALKEHTFLVVDMEREEKFIASSWWNYEFSGPLNILYASAKGISGIGTHSAMSDIILRQETTQGFIENRDIDTVKESTFRGDISYNPKNILVASFHDGVLDINGDINFPATDKRVNIDAFINNSLPDRILYDNNKSYPFRFIIGEEPTVEQKSLILRGIQKKILDKHIMVKDWRYFYQNAIVFSKRNDFTSVVKLYNETYSLGYYIDFPVLPEILMPFISALYITHDYTQGSSLLWQWSIYSNGSHEKAVVMKDNILMLGKYQESVNILEKDINRIWKTSNRK
jgi:hypothetical protein